MQNRFMFSAAISAFGATGIIMVLWSAGYGTAEISNERDKRPHKVRRFDDDRVVKFCSARPIWPKGREAEKNLFVGFRAVVDRPESGTAVLRITGSSVYRIFLNGNFLGYGPARGPHGYWRVDQWPLKDFVAAENVLAVEVAGYNVNSYYLLDQPSFLQAEVIAEGKVLASTAGKGTPLEACILTERVQKVQRYSFQRTFIEYYRLRADYGHWRRDKSAPFVELDCEILPDKKLLARRIGYPRFSKRQPIRHITRGRIQTGVKVEHLWKGRGMRQRRRLRARARSICAGDFRALHPALS